MPFQYTLSIRPIIAPYQYTLVLHTINIPYQRSLLIHPIKISSSHRAVKNFAVLMLEDESLLSAMTEFNTANGTAAGSATHPIVPRTLGYLYISYLIRCIAH